MVWFSHFLLILLLAAVTNRVTIVLMGGATEPLMDSLKIRMNVDNHEYMKVWHKQRRLRGRFLHFGTYIACYWSVDRWFGRSSEMISGFCGSHSFTSTPPACFLLHRNRIQLHISFCGSGSIGMCPVKI